MSLERRPLQNDLLNMRSQVGASPREQQQREQRIATRLANLNCFIATSQRKQSDIGVYCIDPANHGPPKDFDIVKARRLVKKPQGKNDDEAVIQDSGVQKMSRAQWQEKQFQSHFIDQSDQSRMANVYHARQNERAVIGTNFVPDSVDDLPECERQAVLEARRDCVDRLNYEVRNHDYMRDYWRVFVKERAGEILAPPFGVVGPC